MYTKGDTNKLSVEIAGNTHHITCEANSYSKPVDAALVAACKSIHPLD